jgi:O-antigen/teichoic acid export membrane protein
MNRSVQVAYRAASDLAGKGAFFVVTLLAARRLSHEAFGIFSIGTTLGWMAAVASDFGIQMHLARSVAHDAQRAADLLAAWLRVRAWLSAGVIAIAAAIAAVTASGGNATLAILLITIAYVAAGLVESVNYFYRGLGRTEIESTLTIVQRAALLLMVAGALWLSPTVVAVGVAMVAPPAAALAWSVVRARTLAAAASPSGAARRQPIDVRGELRRDVLPIGAGIVLSAVYFRIDVLLLQLWNSTDAVATYNAMFRLVDGLRLMPAAIVAVALPALCRATTLQPLLRTSVVATGTAIVVAALLWLAAGSVVPLLYGSSYANGVSAFRILLLAYPLMSLNHALTCQLIGWHGHRAYAATCAAALLVNVTANAAVLPAYGIAGAAWTTVATEIVITLGSIGALIPRSARAALVAGREPQADLLGAF